MNTRRRLESLTADLVDPPPRPVAPMPPAVAPAVSPAVAPAVASTGSAPVVETRFPPVMPGVPAARTGPGQMMAFQKQMEVVENEAAQLRDKLAQYAGSAPARHLDCAIVHPSPWANRHKAAFSGAQFERLKADIESAGGNVQPIVVRSFEDREGHYEIVFGHRRHRACADLGLKVFAVIWPEPMNDKALFSAMERENRERADLSPFEQGTMYKRALDEQLYPSQRRLAEALGVSHTWVRKALTVAELPEAIIDCFRSPLEIQHRHAQVITAALESDRKGVLRRAEKLRARPEAPTGVVRQLLGTSASAEQDSPISIRADGKTVGHLTRAASGEVAIRLSAIAVPQDKIKPLLEAIERSLS